MKPPDLSSNISRNSSSPSDSYPRDATEEEIKILPHVVDRIPFAAWAVILAGAAERFTYFGVIAPWRKDYLQIISQFHTLLGSMKANIVVVFQKTTCNMIAEAPAYQVP